MPRMAATRIAGRLYRRWLAPRLGSDLSRQRLKLAWHIWGYRRLLALSAVPIRTRLAFLRAFLRVDWNVLHAHEPLEISALCAVLTERAAKQGEIVVEAGCWGGGSAAKLSLVCARFGYAFHIYDSFQGVEPTGRIPGEYDFSGEYAAAEALVRANIGRYGEPSVCTFHPGWFSDTLAVHPIQRPVRLAYIDCDVAKGTREAISGIYPALVSDGVVFSHDSHIRSVRRVLLDPGTWRGRQSHLTQLTRRLARMHVSCSNDDI